LPGKRVWAKHKRLRKNKKKGESKRERYCKRGKKRQKGKKKKWERQVPLTKKKKRDSMVRLGVKNAEWLRAEVTRAWE